MTARLDYAAQSPELFKKLGLYSHAAHTASIEAAIIDLVNIRASQLNGCAFCVDMHVRDLRKHGERWQRINSLCTWREAGLYSPRERAALNWAESLTRLVEHHGGRDADFEQLQGQFSDQEIVELCWVVAQISAWNRMCVGLNAPVFEKEIA